MARRHPVAVILSLLISSCVPDWTRGDTAREAFALGLTAVDWRQTRRIVVACDEANPLIGRCNTVQGANVYFAWTGMFHIAMVMMLPHGPWRSGWQLLTAGAEGNQVWHNWSDGWAP